MFLKLGKSPFDEAEGEGAHITVGFSNASSYLGHMKLDWFDINTKQRMINPLNREDAPKLRIPDKFKLILSGLYHDLGLSHFLK